MLSEFNKVDGFDQVGWVMWYVLFQGEGCVVVVDFFGCYVKEILVDDVDGDGCDELYVVVEVVLGGQVEIWWYDVDIDFVVENIIVMVDDKLMCFFIVGDIDGDGNKEMVVVVYVVGFWLFCFLEDFLMFWVLEFIDVDLGGFEYVLIFFDLDLDGCDELYVVSDQYSEVLCYIYNGEGWDKEFIVMNFDNLSCFIFNINVVLVELLLLLFIEEGVEIGIQDIFFILGFVYELLFFQLLGI